jgi:methanogenic corrinoid protein MtbC1
MAGLSGLKSAAMRFTERYDEDDNFRKCCYTVSTREFDVIDTDKLREIVGKLEEDQVHVLLDEFIASKHDSAKTWKVVEAFQQGMGIVSENFDIGRYCTGDLIFAGELLDSSMKKLEPLMDKMITTYRGRVLLGTVEGDIHNIGKNILKTLTEISGFMVKDLGVDQKPQAFVKAIQEYQPHIVGLSGVLTTTIASMKHTVDAINEAGLRNSLKISIGGNAVNEEICQYVGADAWTRNAAKAVKIYQSWITLANAFSA